ncbi:RNA polymerase sigma factor [Paraglaciecola marina]|uniref:RNA polymerase sigma factor n=1 Tax=Paraglaciecola marina TaxID=2500157 RepID=UPI001060F384|nr:RNA polymerase sigma factor [Paraglaciecola marina]
MLNKNNKFDKLIIDALPGLFRFLRGMSLNAAEAEDIVQDTCERLIRAQSTDKINNVINLKAYMYSTAKNITLNEFRRNKNKQKAIDTIKVQEGQGQPANIENAIEAQQDLQQVLEAINTLPPKCRETFILRHVEQLSYKEIAERQQVSIGTVEKHLAKGVRYTHLLFKSIKKGSDTETTIKKTAS